METCSGTRSPPKVTTPAPTPGGPALERFGHPAAPLTSSTNGAHVTNPAGLTLTPAGAYTSSPVRGDGNPPYSLPPIVTCVSTSPPAPKLSPVPGNPGMGSTLTFSVPRGAAEALTANASASASASDTKTSIVTQESVRFMDPQSISLLAHCQCLH